MDDGTQALQKPHRDGAGFYCILVFGLLNDHWELELQMQISYQETPLGVTTTLNGELPDQCSLLGVLNRLAMWGYLILEVQYESALTSGDASNRAGLPR